MTDMMPASAPRRRIATWTIAAALALATLLLYAPVFRFEFVRYDDPHYVLLNPRVSKGLSWDNARWTLTAFEVGNWHPLTLISHMTDVSVFGLNAGGHHAVNAVFHAVNAALLFLLLYGATRSRAPSLVAAVLFAVHPLNVESVAWVSQRKSVLCMFFLLLTLIAYVAWARRGGGVRYAMAIVATAAALAAKPIAVVLPVLLLLVDFWPLSRCAGDGRDRQRSWVRLALEKAPFAALAAAASIATIAAQKAGGALESWGDYGTAGRLARTAFAYAWYLLRMVWPRDLSLFYPTTVGAAAPLKVAGSVILLAVVTAAVATRARSKPYLAFGWAWYVAALVPVVGFVTFGTQLVADRYAYLALIGPFVAIAFLGADLVEGRSAWLRRSAAGATSAAVLALAFGTGYALAPWRDSLSILQRGFARAPDNVHAIANLGLELVKLRRYDEGIVLLTRAASIRPHYATVHAYLGYAYAQTGRFAQAREAYEEALRQQPGDPALDTELGQVLVQLSQNDDAEARFLEAIRSDPGYGNAWLSLGLLLHGEGRLVEAEPALDKAVALMPQNAGPLTARGVNLAALGRRDEALETLRRALALDPSYVPARSELSRIEGEGSRK